MLARSLAVIALGAALGCGGGGGGGAARPPVPPVFVPRTTPVVTLPPDDAGFATRRANFEASPEYDVSFTVNGVPGDDIHLRQIGAAYAYARGATGAGETIVVVDSGIDASHRELQGKVRVITGIGDSCAPADAAAGRCSGAEHGTAVAAVAAGNRGAFTSTIPLNMQGVAFDANINFIPIELRGSSPTLRPLLALNEYPWGPSDRAQLDSSANYRRYIAQGAILNFSFGAPWALSEWRTLGSNCGAIDETGPLACYRYFFRPEVNALAQASRDPADRSIVVIAAGNENGGNHDRDDNRDMLGPAVDATSPATGAAHAVAFNRPGDPDLSHVLAVVALDADGRIASYSNRCGEAKAFCIAAPGGGGTSEDFILAPRAGSGDGYTGWSGTSFAAPIVSGSLAVLREYFRGQLGNTEIVNRLLGTANRGGIYADSDIYGHGLVDLDAATRPSGATTVVTGATLDGPGVAEALTELVSGAAFGDALARGLAEREVAVFDELDAPFFRTLDAYLQPTAATRAGIEDRLARMGDDPRGAPAPIRPGNPITLRLRLASAADGDGDSFIRHSLESENPVRNLELAALSLTTPLGRSGDAFLSLRHHPGWNFGLHADGIVAPGMFSDDDAFASPYLSFARDGEAAGFALPLSTGALRVAAFRGGAQWGERRDYDPSPAHGALFEYRLPQRNRAGLPSGFAIQSGWLEETGRLMGSRPQGAFGDLRSETGFLGATAHKSLSARWTAFAALHLGVSRPEISGDGLLRRVSPLWSSAFGVGISGRGLWLARDRLSLRLSQPLRVEAGHADLRWVSGRTRYRQVQLEAATLNLAPSARQLDFELAYALPLSHKEREQTNANTSGWASGAFNLVALATLHPDHSRTNRPEFSLLLRYHREF